MKRRVKLIPLILVLVMCIGLIAACAPATTPAAPGTTPEAPPAAAVPEGVIGGGEQGVVVIPGENVDEDTVFVDHINFIIDNTPIAVINPLSPASAVTSTNWVFTMVYDRLLNLADDGVTLLPGLAVEWETDDFLNITFTLREGVTWHNGDRFTAADVVNTVNMAQTIGLGSPLNDRFREVATVEAIDDYTVRMVLDAVNVDFLLNMTTPQSSIVNQSAIDADPETGSQIGTGAFIVDSFLPHDSVEFLRNPNWWNEEDFPVTERITMQFVPEMPTRTIMMQTGQAHISFGTPAGDLPYFMDNPEFIVFTTTSNDPQGLFFNLLNPVTADYYFRRAVLHALNRHEIGFGAAGPWADGFSVVDGAYWGYQTPFRNTSIELLPFDQDLARHYLSLSNYNGEVVTLTTAIMTNIMASEVIQGQLLEVGINVEIIPLDPPGFAASIVPGGTDHQMGFFFNQMLTIPGTAHHVFTPGAGQNRANFDNPEVSALLEEAARTLDRDEREQIYFRVQELVAESLAYTNVFWRRFGNVARSEVGGMRLMPDPFSHDFRGLFAIAE